MKSTYLDKIEMTKEKLRKNLDAYITDEASSTFNELFMREYIQNYLDLLQDPAEVRPMLLFVHVDDIISINKRYSSAIGDETIVNLAYELKQLINDDDMLFKRKGPGYAILIHDSKKINVKDYAVNIQNEIKKSNAFVERITVSIAVVSLADLPEDIDEKERADYAINLASRRINLSHYLGNGTFIDKDTNATLSTAGNILFADSDPLAHKVYRRFFENNNYRLDIADSGINAVNMAKKAKYDAIIVDRYVEKMDGLMIKQHLNESTINMHSLYVLIVQNKDSFIIEQANYLAIDYVLTKPIIFEELQGILEREFKRRVGPG